MKFFWVSRVSVSYAIQLIHSDLLQDWASQSRHLDR